VQVSGAGETAATRATRGLASSAGAVYAVALSDRFSIYRRE
jgi:hypothetical protein